MRSLKNRPRAGLKAKRGSRYSPKEYNNPFFQERKLRKKRTRIYFSGRAKILAAALAALLLLLPAYLIYGPVFKIKNIIAVGEGHIEPAALEAIARGQASGNYFVLYPRDNLFLFKTGKLEEELDKKYAFERLSVEKKLPGTILIKYREKDYAAIFSEDEEYYYIDLSGQIVAAAQLIEVSEKDYPIIVNSGQERISERQAPLAAPVISAITEIFRSFKDLDEDYRIERFMHGDEANTIRLKLAAGPVLMFNSRDDIAGQIEKLKIIKAEKLEGIFKTKEYIDLRHGSSVYYR